MLCSVLFSKIPSKSAVLEQEGLRFTDLVIFFILNAILNGHIHAVIATFSQANICHITSACTTETPQLGGKTERQQETCGVSQRQAESQDIWHAYREVHLPVEESATKKGGMEGCSSLLCPNLPRSVKGSLPRAQLQPERGKCQTCSSSSFLLLGREKRQQDVSWTAGMGLAFTEASPVTCESNEHKPYKFNLPGKNPGENLCRETVMTFEVKLKASSTPVRKGKGKKAFMCHFYT